MLQVRVWNNSQNEITRNLSAENTSFDCALNSLAIKFGIGREYFNYSNTKEGYDSRINIILPKEVKNEILSFLEEHKYTYSNCYDALHTIKSLCDGNTLTYNSKSEIEALVRMFKTADIGWDDLINILENDNPSKLELALVDES